ncbi:MAG: hypothetical protein A2314_01725 [Elusimicrobia bacterium RIFOXYB2_FULL_50_12]|nr:MAG: hypothetical protein A2314_01725 [Elusimicrobia bacterium RIFOXYB2_FULL_50_12]
MEEVKQNSSIEISDEPARFFDEETKMDDLLQPQGAAGVREGAVVTAMVVAETADGFLVDIGLKSEGLIPVGELDGERAREELAVGKQVQVLVQQLHSEKGHPVVSWRQARERSVWETVGVSFKNATPVEGMIRKKIKGGFTVDIGVDAFLPASQLELRMPQDMNKYIGQKFQFLITEANRGQRNVVLSRRKILEVGQKELRGKLFATLADGQEFEGTVSGITDFGAFVDIGGVDGLLHIGDIAWHRIKKVSDVLSVGQKVKVKVLKIDREKEKISLGMKQLAARPWDSMDERYQAGSIVAGKITSVTDFGAFVELEPGLEGLLHCSEVSWTERDQSFKKHFKPGQEIEVKIIAIDKQKEKISLSLKQLQANPWEEVKLRYPSGTRLKGVVTHLTPFGAFVKLAEGMEGLIHVADMSWTKKIRHPQDVLQVGQEIEAVVMDVNPDNEKISLSLKHLSDDPYRRYRTGAVVSGVVKRIVEFGAFIELEPNVEALVRISEMSAQRVENVSDVLAIGQQVEAKVIKCDPQERKIDVSIKKLEHERERELLKKYVNKAERPTLGQLLEEEE